MVLVSGGWSADSATSISNNRPVAVTNWCRLAKVQGKEFKLEFITAHFLKHVDQHPNRLDADTT